MNDIGIMHQSPLFQKIRTGEWPRLRPDIKIGNANVSWFHFVVDGIYPRYRMFLNSYTAPSSPREKAFAQQQEGVRKAVERVFAVLCSRFGVLSDLVRL